MTSKKKKDLEVDPEVLMRRKFRVKCRFRAVGRMVMANTYWLIEAADQYEGVEDVKRRVAQAVRGKTKKKRLLSITDKALLNKPAEDRTEAEKKYIYRIIGGLKCFKRYPNHVKKKLAAVTYFKYYGPNRVIVKQHQEAHALYFIVTGDVIVSQMIFDELLQCDVSVDIGIMHAGDMFGEVSLLHNIHRTATCTTVGHCELLTLMKDDFKNILQASVQRQWDEVRRAMSAFTYFDALDEVARREGCIVAKMKTFATNETILGDGVGVPNFVYFILSGRCQMIESLCVITTHRLGRSFYTLYDPYIPSEESDQDLDTKYFAGYNLGSKTTTPAVSTLETKLPSDEKRPSIEPEEIDVHTQTPKVLSSILKIGSKQPSAQRSSSIKRESITIAENSGPILESNVEVSGATKSEKLNEVPEVKENDDEVLPSPSKDILPPEATRDSVRAAYDKIVTEDTSFLMSCAMPEKAPISAHCCNLRDCSAGIMIGPAPSYIMVCKKYTSRVMCVSVARFSIDSRKIPPPNVRTYFMQVCQFNPGSTFGFGSNMRDRRIVALTPVDCMLLPKMWLLQRNTANIWTRIEHYLDKKIPNKKELFKTFLSERHWHEFRDELVRDVVARSKTVNWTSVHDVPYSIRMEEMIDI